MRCSQIQSDTRRNPRQASGSFTWPLVIAVQNEINSANQALRSHSSAEGQGFPGNKRYSMLTYHEKKNTHHKPSWQAD